MIEIDVKQYSYPNGTPYWLVIWTPPGEKRQRKKFKVEAEANALKDNLVMQYNVGGVTAEELREFQASLHRLRRTDFPGKEHSIRQVFDFFIKHYRATAFPNISAYVDDYINRKSKRLKPKSMVQQKLYLVPFKKDFGHLKPDMMNSVVLENYLATNTSRPYRDKVLRPFFAWLAGAPTTKCTPLEDPPLKRSPMLFVDRAEYKKMGETSILRLDEVKKLIEAAKGDKPLLAYIVFSVFTGIRPEEVQAFWTLEGHGWARIDLQLGSITVTSEIEKTKKRTREVRIRPNLKQWLEWFRANKISPTYSRRTLRALWRKTFPKRSRQDIFRHTFISNACKVMEIHDVTFQCATSVKMIRDHYLRLVAKGEAIKFFQLKPKDFGL